MAAARSVWKGFIQFSMVSVPVKAYTSTQSEGGTIALNQLHKTCNSRIRMPKTCPVHGEVKGDEIVMGYEYADGQYVIIDPTEIEKLRPAQDRSVRIGGFIKSDAIDPVYYSGRTNYLVPDGPVGQKPYALLLKVLTEEKRVAFAQVVMNGKDQLVVLRPMGDLIGMTFLVFEAQVRKPTEFKDEAPKVEVSPQEMALAKTLTEALEVEDFDLSKYKDHYSEKLRELIEAKIAGKEVVAPPSEESPQVINLMEALQKSVEQAKKAATPAAAAKPPKIAAPSTAAAGAKETRKRKSS
jgi:DNA end-binding protein Ku